MSNNFGKLYIVGLPIGNWEDISLRALKHLQIAKNVVMETQEGLNRILTGLNISNPNVNFISMNISSEDGEAGFSNEVKNLSIVINLLKSGEDVYVISDEGMPGVADPGELIIKTAVANDIEVKIIPGPSCAIVAIAATGCSSNFTFESFPPENKNDRRIFLENKKFIHAPMVFVLRNRSFLENGLLKFHPENPELFMDAYDILGPERNAALCYNLTKTNEKIIRGNFLHLYNYFINNFDPNDQISMVIDTAENAFSRMNTSRTTNG